MFKYMFDGNYHVFPHLNFDVPLEGKDLFLGGQNMKYNLTCAYLTKAILGILSSQIEVERIFSIQAFS